MTSLPQKTVKIFLKQEQIVSI